MIKKEKVKKALEQLPDEFSIDELVDHLSDVEKIQQEIKASEAGNIYTTDNAKEKLLERIDLNPEIMLGKPVIRGTRIPVELILKQLGQGISQQELLEDYPHLTVEDIKAALFYAAGVLSDEEVYLFASR